MNNGRPRRSYPEVLPLVSPCPKAPYAMGLRPSVLTYGPVGAGRLLPKKVLSFTLGWRTWQPLAVVFPIAVTQAAQALPQRSERLTLELLQGFYCSEAAR
jgi:hypothetical protein